MKIMNKDFGNRLWGMSFVIWYVFVINQAIYPLWAKVLCGLVMTYFFMFGASRFEDSNYKKLI